MKNQKYLKVIKPAPILNTPDFSSVFGKILKTDEKGHIRALEFVALKNQTFEISKIYPNNICKVKTPKYPNDNLFIDKRFTVKTDKLENKIELPNKNQVLKKLLSFPSLPYIWGSNWSGGIPEINSYYPGKDASLKRLLKGVDCSGLLYEVTKGYTPRNTKELLIYGKGLNIAHKTEEEIIPLLKPLDLIVFQGHVIIILSLEKTIESKESAGVFFSNPFDVLKKLFVEKIPANKWSSEKDFVIRRWIS